MVRLLGFAALLFLALFPFAVLLLSPICDVFTLGADAAQSTASRFPLSPPSSPPASRHSPSKAAKSLSTSAPQSARATARGPTMHNSTVNEAAGSFRPLARSRPRSIAATKPDGSLQAALRAASPRARFVLLTFGDSKVADHLLNFCHHAQRSGVAHIVGAVDVKAFELLAARRIATYKTPLAYERYTMDGSNSHSSGSWKRFAAMRTGEVMKVVHLGYDVLHSDTDIVWLRDPTAYLLCTAAAQEGEFSERSQFPCGALQRADIAVSSDNMGPSRAVGGGAAYHAAGTFNSGILLFRATEAGRRFVADWHRNVANPPRGSRFYGKTSDQQVFNAMVRKELQWPGVGGRRGQWLMDSIHPEWQGKVTLGALPLPLFANGHGYFVQSAHSRLHVAPFAVHATYSLDWHDGVAKRQRFREAGLWAVDPPPAESERFLALNGTVPPTVAEAVRRFRRDKKTPFNVEVHRVALQAYVAELRDALALARALKRTLILPQWLCYCDKLWAGSDNIVNTKFMYPGSQDAPFLPFRCPMDHVLSPHAWHEEKIQYRDPSFLSSLLSAPDRQRSHTGGPLVRDVQVVGPDEFRARAGSHGADMLPRATHTAMEAARLLETSGDWRKEALIIRLSDARRLLCGMGSVRETREFNTVAGKVLRVPPWCTRIDRGTDKVLAQFLSPSEMPRAFLSRSREWCLRTATPPAFKHGKCVLNM